MTMQKKQWKQFLLFGLAALWSIVVSAAPQLDGKLDDAEWSKAHKFDQFSIYNSKLPGYPCTALLLHDQQSVYIGFKVPFINGTPPVAEATQRDGRVFSDDSVEVMIAPGASPDRYAHILVNSKGVINDGYADQGGFLRDEKWNGAVRAVGFVGPDFWSVEIQVPYSTLELDGVNSPVWGFNFCHNSNPRQSSSIAPNGVYHVASAFVKVPGFDIDYARYQLRISPPQITVAPVANGKFKLESRVNIANISGSERNFKLDLTLLGPDIAAKTVNCKLAGNGAEDLKLPPMVIKQSGDYTAIVSVLDPSSRQVDIRRNFPLNVVYSPLSITLISPSYRNAIFATQDISEVVYRVDSADKLGSITTGITDAAGKILCEKKLDASGMVHFPAKNLPEGKFTIFASAGKARSEHPLFKLPRKQGEVWRDEQGFWRIDGKRCFMIVEWVDRHVPGANISTLDTNCKRLSCSLQYSNFISKMKYNQPVLSDSAEKILRNAILKERDTQSLFAWMLVDEPECAGMVASTLARAADILRELDPWHPILISNDSLSGYYDFFQCAEINGMHPYPSPQKGKARPGFGRIIAVVDTMNAFNRKQKSPQSLCYLQQGFNYGDYGNMDSRIPTFDEIRVQFWITVIMGGRGIMFYNRTTDHYPELKIGMPEVGKEFAALQDILVLDDQPGALTSGKLRTMIKKSGDEIWIFAASTQIQPFDYTFDMPELGNRKLQVWREGREITAQNGKFQDRFNNFDVHIYTTSQDRRGIRPAGEVEAEIADANAKRRKPGNLAFQMFEHDSLKLRASSNQAFYQRADRTLWHVTDGVNLGDSANYLNVFTFTANAPLPDWLEIEFPQAVTFGRMLVFPVNHSIQDCEAQVWSNGAWKTVASVKDFSGKMLEFKFPAETSAKVRVLVTARRGKSTIIGEIEIYEK